MTTREKAIELVDKYTKAADENWIHDQYDERIVKAQGKEYALMCVDTVLQIPYEMSLFNAEAWFRTYWLSVKQEIEKIA